MILQVGIWAWQQNHDFGPTLTALDLEDAQLDKVCMIIWRLCLFSVPKRVKQLVFSLRCLNVGFSHSGWNQNGSAVLEIIEEQICTVYISISSQYI